MDSKNILIITRTIWEEPPRIRHQVTRLLNKNNFNITYVEIFGKGLKNASREEEGMQFIRIAELIPMELRPFSWIENFNNYFVRKILKKHLTGQKIDLVINFNYNFTFIPKLFPHQKLITIINDDFYVKVKKWMRPITKKQLEKTCSISNTVLTVSYPLFDQLLPYNKNTKLFFPWSEKEYAFPSKIKKRNIILYFGYISRIDWEIVRALVEGGYKLRFVGPVPKKSKKIVNKFQQYPNIEFLPSTSFKDLNTDDVFCSIAPYDLSIKSIHAATVSNRSFKLLAKGIPLVFPNMKALIKAPNTIIKKYHNYKTLTKNLAFFQQHFYNIQGDIEDFVGNHTEKNRVQFFMKELQ